MKKLNWKQRMLRMTKKQKQKAPLHTTVAFLILLTALILWPRLSPEPTVSAAVAAGKEAGEMLSLVMVGDLMMGRHVEEVAQRKGYDVLFDEVRPWMRSADLVTGNFNQVILKQDPEIYPRLENKIRIHTGVGAAHALKKAGFTSVNLANTHMMDYGGPGMTDTITTFRKAGVESVGAGQDRYDSEQILYQEVNGIRVATLGMTDVPVTGTAVRQNRPGVRSANLKSVLPLVRSAEKNADLVVVHIHWGVQYDNHIHPRQRAIGQALADAGADLILGHHPHVLEPVEFYKGSVILYSAGNFITDQGWSRTQETALFRYRLFKDGKARFEVHPMMIREARPRPLTGRWEGYRREKIYLQLSEVSPFSDLWKKRWKREGDFIVHELDHSRVIKNRTGTEGR